VCDTYADDDVDENEDEANASEDYKAEKQFVFGIYVPDGLPCAFCRDAVGLDVGMTVPKT
jgi:hypothetical protein